jgi:hypothetical protein
MTSLHGKEGSTFESVRGLRTSCKSTVSVVLLGAVDPFLTYGGTRIGIAHSSRRSSSVTERLPTPESSVAAVRGRTATEAVSGAGHRVLLAGDGAADCGARRTRCDGGTRTTAERAGRSRPRPAAATPRERDRARLRLAPSPRRGCPSTSWSRYVYTAISPSKAHARRVRPMRRADVPMASCWCVTGRPQRPPDPVHGPSRR